MPYQGSIDELQLEQQCIFADKLLHNNRYGHSRAKAHSTHGTWNKIHQAHLSAMSLSQLKSDPKYARHALGHSYHGGLKTDPKSISQYIVQPNVEKDNEIRELKLKINRMETELSFKSQQINDLQAELTKSKEMNNRIPIRAKVSSKVPSSRRQIYQSLHEQAKVTNLGEFVKICEEVLIGGVVEIHAKQTTVASPEEVVVRIDMATEGSAIGDSPEQVQERLRAIVRAELDHITCPQPCCKARQVKVASALQKTRNAQHKNFTHSTGFYRNDKSVEYFSRYYPPQFEVQRVQSLQKTKAEEMAALQRLHHKNLLRRQKQAHRN